MIIFKQPRVDCFFPSLIKAGATLLGGYLGQKTSAKTAQKQQKSDQDFQAEQNRIARQANAASTAQDRQLQKQFAQYGVSWKAADARRAGLDPTVAMGSSTLYSPSAIPASPGQSIGSGYQPDNSYMERAGQDIGTAIGRLMTKEQINHNLEMQSLQRERANLENDNLLIKNMQLQGEINNYPTQVAVPAPSTHQQTVEGQGDSGAIVQPDIVTRHQGGHKMGVHAMKQYRLGATQADGSIPVYSAIEQEAGDAMDADLPTKARYNAREWGKVVKSWAGVIPKNKPKVSKPGYRLQWSRAYGQWMLVPKKRTVTPARQRRRYDMSRDREKMRSNPTFKRYKIY